MRHTDNGWARGAMVRGGGVRGRTGRAMLAVPVLLAVLAAGACTDDVPGAGADLSQVGPQSNPPTVPPGPDPGGSASAAPTASTNPTERLAEKMSQALRRTDPATHAETLTVERRPDAGNQLVVKWTVTSDSADKTARQRVRGNIVEVLRVVKTTSLAYGSVLVIVTGTVRDPAGGDTDAEVVRAKYTRQLVARTNFAAVSPDRVLALPDDKPAEIHPAYK